MSSSPSKSSSTSTSTSSSSSSTSSFLRHILIREGELLLADSLLHRIANAASTNILDRQLALPTLGDGERSKEMVISLLDMLEWRDLIHLAECSNACCAVVCARFASTEMNQVECTPKQLEYVVKSRVCRYARHVSVLCCGEGQLVRSRSRSRSSSSDSNSSSFSFPLAATESLRSLPLLRHLLLHDFTAEDSELLVHLTRRPVPSLLQSVTLTHFAALDTQSIECFRRLTALHTLVLHECGATENGMFDAFTPPQQAHGASSTMRTSISPCFSHLHTLVLNLTPSTLFPATSLLPLIDLVQLRRLQLNLLCAPPGFVQSIFRSLFTSVAFQQRLESLSLCYVDIHSVANNSGTAGGNSVSSPSSSASSTAPVSLTRPRSMTHADYALFGALSSIKHLELCWTQPLALILPHLHFMSSLEVLRIGDDNLALLESSLDEHLLRIPKLHDIEVYGYIGVPVARMKEIEMRVQQKQTKLHPLKMRYTGERRTINKNPSHPFAWTM